MKTDFYLLNQSFRYQTGISAEELQLRLQHLASDYEFIRQHKDTDKIKKHDSIYDEIIFENLSVADILYGNKWKNLLDRDVVQHLRTIIDKSEMDTIEPQEVIEVLLSEHNENQVFALLCLHEIADIEKPFLVYSKNNWLEFHRHFLKIYPNNTYFYFQECIKYFPQLHFHPRNESTISNIFSSFSSKIIEHLSYLNDSFHLFKTEPFNPVEALKRFSSYCNLDETASNEGDTKRKKDFTFDFENDTKQIEQVCCEPHLKLSRSDNYPGDTEYYYHRIYFHQGKTNIAQGKILIGHIGKHL